MHTIQYSVVYITLTVSLYTSTSSDYLEMANYMHSRVWQLEALSQRT